MAREPVKELATKGSVHRVHTLFTPSLLTVGEGAYQSALPPLLQKESPDSFLGLNK